MQLIVINFIN